MSSGSSKKTDDSGITRFMAEGRSVTDASGSFRLILPRSLGEEWDLQNGDQILITAEEGSDTATLHKPSSKGGFKLVRDDEE